MKKGIIIIISFVLSLFGMWIIYGLCGYLATPSMTFREVLANDNTVGFGCALGIVCFVVLMCFNEDID